MSIEFAGVNGPPIPKSGDLTFLHRSGLSSSQCLGKRGNVGGSGAAAASDDPCAACGHQGSYFSEIFRGNFVKVAAIVIAWPPSVRESGERGFRPGKLLDEPKGFLRTVDAIDSEDFGVVL